jgi:hypothetical protein
MTESPYWRIAAKNWLLHACHWDTAIVGTVDGKTALVAETNEKHAALLCEALNSYASLKARISELEANEKAYEEIIGPMTYRQVADRIGELEAALRESLTDNAWNAYNCGITRADGKWMDGGMSDAEWLKRELGLGDGWHDATMIRNRIPEVVEKQIANLSPKDAAP